MGRADFDATTVLTRFTVSSKSCRGIVIFMGRASCACCAKDIQFFKKSFLEIKQVTVIIGT
jgi:hypothetical protein